MGNLANKFLEAVNIISDAKTKSADFDRSVQVTIKKLYQEDSTKYEVEYEGALKTATGATGYKTNDVVWAVVPRNDLTQILQIIGLVSSIAADKQVLRSEDDEFEKVTANLATFTTEQKLQEGNMSVVLWKHSSESNIISTSDNDLFKNAINSSLYFEINALFESEIDIKQDINFGIRCYCNGVINTPKFILDINDISGNPYYLIGERQKKIFSITTDETLDSFDKIEFFAEGLSANDEVVLKGFSFYGCRDVDYMTGLAANLLVSETGIDFRELGGLSTNNYNLTTADNLILKANLRYDGVLVTENELSKYTYKWCLKTLKDGLPIEIVIGDNPNTKDIVETWYFNKEESDDRIIPSDWFSTIEDAPNQLKVSAAALFMPNSWVWCEVVDEKGNKVKTVEGWIDNADKSYDLSLVVNSPKLQNDLTYRISLEIKNGKKLYEENKASFQWIIDDILRPGLTRYEILYPANGSTIKCKVYTENNFLIFTDSTKLDYIPDAPNMDVLSLSITGKSVYLCKADGEFIGQTENLKVYIYKEGRLVEDLTDYKIEWSIPTEDTMLTLDENPVLNQQELKFNVQKYLLNSYINNVISVNVSYEQENLAASSSIGITFLKNGWPGTNGTDIICYFEKDGQALNYYQGNASDITKSDVVVKRASTGTSIDIPLDNISLERILSEESPMYIKATCTSQDRLSIWYGYLPIVTCSSPADFTLIEPSGVPFVQFSSGGKIADNLPLVFTASKNIADVSLQDEDTYFQVEQSDVSARATISLINDFESFRGNKNYEVLTLTDESGNTITIPILLLTNRFEYATINGWDGTSIKLDEENNTVLAPMAGFGQKEQDNTFTGVVLGNITSDSNDDNFQGIIGMHKSSRTFSLDAKTGDLFAKGHIEAESGKIGGWQLNEGALLSKNGVIGLYPDEDKAPPIQGTEDRLLIKGGEPKDIQYPFYWEEEVKIIDDNTISISPPLSNPLQVSVKDSIPGWINDYTEIIQVPSQTIKQKASYVSRTKELTNFKTFSKSDADVEYYSMRVSENETGIIGRYYRTVTINGYFDNYFDHHILKIDQVYFIPTYSTPSVEGFIFKISNWSEWDYNDFYNAEVSEATVDIQYIIEGKILDNSKIAVNPTIIESRSQSGRDYHTLRIQMQVYQNSERDDNYSTTIYNLSSFTSKFFNSKSVGTITYKITETKATSEFTNIFCDINSDITPQIGIITSPLATTRCDYLPSQPEEYLVKTFASFNTLNKEGVDLNEFTYEDHHLINTMTRNGRTVTANWFIQPNWGATTDLNAVITSLTSFYTALYTAEPDQSQTINTTTTFTNHSIQAKSNVALQIQSSLNGKQVTVGWPFNTTTITNNNFILTARKLSDYGMNNSVTSVSYNFSYLLYYINTNAGKVPGFGITHEGKMIAQDAFINGDIDAKSLKFAISHDNTNTGSNQELKLFDVNFYAVEYEVVFTATIDEDPNEEGKLLINTGTSNEGSPIVLKIRRKDNSN